MKKVEQIYKGIIVNDFDEKKGKKEILEILQTIFENVEVKKNYFEVNGIKLFIKNITYLGNPHPNHKKRIQISKGWGEYLKDENSYLIGLYSYKTTQIFVLFDKENFIKRDTNNSSAHVSSLDLLKAYELGYFSKIDIRGNKIYLVTKQNFKNFLQNYRKGVFPLNEELSLFQEFKKLLTNYPKWYGIDAIKELIKFNFPDKYQSEWAGFYFEFLFEQFIKNNNYLTIVEYIKHKKLSEIDLDLYFKKSNFYGDLKTHSTSSSAILGNDKTTINKALSLGKIWYVVLSHQTIKDSEKEFEVTIFWNKLRNKSNLYSYGKRMKNSVILDKLQILEINNFNKQYLSDFKQGKNSNGKERNVKIKINKKDINNFLIFNERI